MKGQKLLKVCSILLIIGGALNVLFGAIGAAAGAVVGAFILIVPFIIAAIQLAAGIVGVKTSNEPGEDSFRTAMTLIVLMIIFSLVYSIYNLAQTTGMYAGFSGAAVANILLGLLVPALYLVGLLQYRSALSERQHRHEHV
ncbi:MAG: hypothetical protein LBM18_04685 [Oscillospiraceae bacterium]|nr:hypothetical protein [Oscillospiraceae bacterium]